MIFKGLIYLVMGLTLLWVSWNNWRYRDDREAVPWVEDQILKAIDEEPLPRSSFDYAWRRVQAGLGLVLGVFFTVIGLLLILEFGE